MWTRAELKERAKEAFRRNYWMCVVAGLILSLLAGGSSSGGSSSDSSSSDYDSIKELFSDDSDYSGYVEDDTIYYYEDNDDELFSNEVLTALGIAGVVVLVIALVIMVVSIVYGIFVGSIFEIGGCRFFTVNATENASLRELLHGFTGGNYLRNVSIQFFRTLYTFLWSLLFVIPGIVKSYEYLMVPYILADNPNITREEAFALSKRMMDGNKWDAFVLNLSFIGWILATVVTCGIVGLFWVDPYIRATNAELYLKLKSNVMPVKVINDDQYGWDDAQRI